MKYAVYKTTNTVNGKFYVGTHKTLNINDGYLGSGKLLIRAIKKYGEEYFQKYILAEFDNPEDMFLMEAQIVDEGFVADPRTYNIKKGGNGGFDYINQNGLSLNFNHINQNNLSPVGSPEFIEDYRKDFSRGGQTAIKILNAKVSNGELVSGFKNKHHTLETRSKISKTLQENKHQQGKKNSQFGKPRPDKVKEKIRQTLMSKPIIQCPHCDCESRNKGLMNRWHFNNCRSHQE